MPKYISHRWHGVRVQYERSFMRKNGAGGFAFPCDEHGNLIEDPSRSHGTVAIFEERVASLVADVNYRDEGVRKDEWPITTPAVIECENCKGHVSLWGFTNGCACGADYNMSGQLLAPREQWGEETGESVSDILMPDSDYDGELDSGRDTDADGHL